MKRVLSILIAAVMVLSMIPAVYAAEPVVITSGTNVAATVAQPVTYTWTAESDGTLTVTMGAASPGWRFTIFDAAGNTVGLPKSGKVEKSNDFELTAGQTYTFSATGFNSSTWDEVAANITYTLTFISSEESGEIELAQYEISNTALTLGDNNLSLLETAYTTIYVYEPTETGVFTFTAPEGAILGYWGAGSWFLSDPGSTTNSYEWTCTGVGQSAYIGVSNVTGNFCLNVAKTGDYTVVEIPTILYENKATLTPFTLPEGSKLGSYIDVTNEAVYTAVLGDDGYYHLNSADGDIILVDMNYQDIILSNALLSDRPVMYAYVTDEDGNTVKYDIGEAVKEYETVMDANGYYPLTEDLILFYDVYGNGSAIYSYHVAGRYNEENVWMYCMRTVTFPEITEPEETEPEVTEPEITEPEETEPEVTEPEETEPEVTEPEITEPEVTEPLEPADPLETLPNTFEAADNVPASVEKPVVYTWTAPANGTLTVQMNATTPGWRYEIRDAEGNTVGLAQTGRTYKTATFTLTGNETYTFNATGFEFDTWSETSANISYALSFVADSGSGEVEKVEKVVSAIKLTVGDNTLTLDETAITTIYKFTCNEAGTYRFTAPYGAIVGYWGATNNYLVNPNNNSNTCDYTFANAGPSAFIGISGVDGEFILTVAKVEVTEPEETEPTEPEETEPEVTEPEETEPEETEPEETGPNTSVPEVPAGTVFAVVVNGEVTPYTGTSAKTLNTAVESVESNATVILYEDISLGNATFTIPAEKNIVLDLNGCTLTANKSNGGTITVNGTLTVQDSSTAGNGLISNTSTSTDRGILVDSTGILNLNGGNVSSKTQAIRVESGKMTMTGGNVSATQYGVYGGGTSNVTISGGTVSAASGTFYHAVYGGGSATMSITGGYFVGGALKCSGLVSSISGGFFTTAPNSSMIAANCEIQDNDDPVYLYKVVDPNAQPEEPEPEEPEKLVEEWNLVLDDDLLVNFYLNLAEDAQVQITVGSETFTYSASQLAKTDDGKYIASVRLAAAQMTDAITLQIVGSEEDAVTYTVRQYADIVLADNTLSAYHALIKEMLNYGGAAQNYFEYNTGSLANADITGVAAKDVPEGAEDVAVSDRISALNFYGASLVYRDKIAVRFYFTGDVTGCTFTANGNTYTAQENGDMYYVEIADILPQDLDQQIELTVTDANGNEISVTYGPMNYIVRMNVKGSDSLKALLKALYNYHLAAKALRTAA